MKPSTAMRCELWCFVVESHRVLWKTGVRMICHVSTHINDVYIYTYSKLIDSYISIYYVYIYVYIHINLNLLHDTSLHHCQRKTRHFLLKNRSHFYYFPIRNCCGNHHPWTLFEPYLGYVFFSSRFQVDANSQRVCVSCRWMMSLRNITAFSRWGTVVVWGDWLLVVSSIRVLVVFFKKTDTN